MTPATPPPAHVTVLHLNSARMRVHVSLSHGQLCWRAHCSSHRWPPSAADAHVLQSHGSRAEGATAALPGGRHTLRSCTSSRPRGSHAASPTAELQGAVVRRLPGRRSAHCLLKAGAGAAQGLIHARRSQDGSEDGAPERCKPVLSQAAIVGQLQRPSAPDPANRGKGAPCLAMRANSAFAQRTANPQARRA